MTDERDNLILSALGAIGQQLDRIEGRQDEIIVRFGVLERDVAALNVDFAGMQVRLDTLDRRFARIECRLELPPAEVP